MAQSWQDINERIADCRRSRDQIACLRRLFDDTDDGFVALNLAQALERRGGEEGLREALGWFERAEKLLPLEKWKQTAREGADRVRRALKDAPPSPTSESVLVVVACTKRKIWDDDPNAPTFVPARQAYVGPSLPDWVRQGEDEASGAPWLFLSAKYGFIEPDHPIASYDVTFGDERTGPMSSDSLRAQVERQMRFGSLRLRDVSEVRVVGGPDYVERTSDAFRGTGARLPGAPDQRMVKPGRAPGLVAVPERAQAVGRALAALTPATIDAIDRGEPEWETLRRLRELPDSLGLLTAIVFGLCDYRLQAGGATVYWQVADRELQEKAPLNAAGVEDLARRLMEHPVAALDADKKLSRVHRLLASGFPEWLRQYEVRQAGAELAELWHRLAKAMNNPLHAKTIVFAVKLVDLMGLQATGERGSLPLDMPIAVDIRVARAAIASGIVRSSAGDRAATLLGHTMQQLPESRDPYVEAWGLVAKETKLSPLRLDSAVWQAAGHLSRGTSPAVARSSIAAMLVGYGADVEAAKTIAAELTHALG
jgi:N-glycosylase/DNA lyase